MKRFVIKLKNKIHPGTIVPSPSDIVDGFNVTWHYFPTEYIGEVSEKEFNALKNKFEATGFYSMFEDTNVHTH